MPSPSVVGQWCLRRAGITWLVEDTWKIGQHIFGDTGNTVFSNDAG